VLKTIPIFIRLNREIIGGVTILVFL